MERRNAVLLVNQERARRHLNPVVQAPAPPVPALTPLERRRESIRHYNNGRHNYGFDLSYYVAADQITVGVAGAQHWNEGPGSWETNNAWVQRVQAHPAGPRQRLWIPTAEPTPGRNYVDDVLACQV